MSWSKNTGFRTVLRPFVFSSAKALEKWNKNDRVSGCIVLLYDHHRRDLNKKSMDIQHQHQNLILSVQHIHLDHDNCLETITVKGRARELKQLSDLLIGLKGVKFGDLVMSALE